MSSAPVFERAAQDAAVRALLGTFPVRLYAFGRAPPAKDTPKPYAVYQTVGGEPDNYLGDRPDNDRLRVQIDAYGTTEASAEAVAKALRYSLEGGAYVVGYNGESQEPDTLLYRSSFDVEFQLPR